MMPPKKQKTGRKRTSLEDGKEESDSKSDVTEMLSPSEVVKMRKKAKVVIQEQPKEVVKEPKGKVKKAATEKTEGRKGKSKENLEKKTKESSHPGGGKTTGKKAEKDATEDKRSKSYREKRKYLAKKKTRSDDSDAEDVPIMYPCGICTKEVSDADDAILCEAGCEFWYHRMCTGMTDIAYQYLTNEENCEWVCDKCIATKSVPLVKIKSVENTTAS